MYPKVTSISLRIIAVLRLTLSKTRCLFLLIRTYMPLCLNSLKRFLAMAPQNETESYDSHRLAEMLQILLDIAEKIKESRSKLYSLYKEWSDITNETAEALDRIGDEIVRYNFNSNIANLTGTSTAIFGSVLTFIGLIVAIPTAGLSLALTASGAVTATLGGAVTTGSTIARNVLSKQQCEEAKSIFLKTSTLTESLEKERELYFSLIDQFKNEMEKYSNQELLAIVSRLEYIFTKDFHLDEDARSSLPPTSQKMDEIQLRDVEQSDIIIHIVKLINLIAEDPSLKRLFYNSDFWKIISKTIKELPPGINLCKDFPIGMVLQGPTGGGLLVGGTLLDSGESLMHIFKGVSMTFQVGMGVLNSIFMIWGIVDLVMTSIDVYNGSTSNESKELSRVADELRTYRSQVIDIMAKTFEWHL